MSFAHLFWGGGKNPKQNSWAFQAHSPRSSATWVVALSVPRLSSFGSMLKHGPNGMPMVPFKCYPYPPIIMVQWKMAASPIGSLPFKYPAPSHLHGYGKKSKIWAGGYGFWNFQLNKCLERVQMGNKFWSYSHLLSAARSFSSVATTRSTKHACKCHSLWELSWGKWTCKIQGTNIWKGRTILGSEQKIHQAS